MSNPEPASPNDSQPPTSEPYSLQRVLRAFTGSLMAGTIAILFYKMLTAVAASFAAKPITSDNVTVIKLSAAVRTLVMGVIALGTGVFAMAALGLSLLGLQMIWRRLTGDTSAPRTTSDMSD